MCENMGKRLDRIIKKEGLTIVEVAKQTGMAKNSVHNLINGHMPTNAKTLKKLCELLDISLDYLIFGIKYEPTELVLSSKDFNNGCIIRISKTKI